MFPCHHLLPPTCPFFQPLYTTPPALPILPGAAAPNQLTSAPISALRCYSRLPLATRDHSHTGTSLYVCMPFSLPTKTTAD